MDRLFLDTNIVLDLLEKREPFVHEAVLLFQLAKDGECQLLVSDLTFVSIAYITRKVYPKERLYSVLSKLSLFLTIVDGGASAVESAISLKADDFEDAVQYFEAYKADADYIITRNKKDFSFSQLKVFTPKEYLFLKHIA